jgi:hypothetical protein
MPRIVALVGLVALLAPGCTQLQGSANNEIVLLGESNLNGERATQQANLALRNAAAAGCRGISVGGYAATTVDPGGIVYGVPVMVSCPAGVSLTPTGSPVR